MERAAGSDQRVQSPAKVTGARGPEDGPLRSSGLYVHSVPIGYLWGAPAVNADRIEREHRMAFGPIHPPGHRGLLDEDEAAKLLGVSARTMQRMRYEGWGPEYVRVGLRRIAYSEAALNAYAAGRTHRSRAAELASAA